jgi:hypothetical protein
MKSLNKERVEACPILSKPNKIESQKLSQFIFHYITKRKKGIRSVSVILRLFVYLNSLVYESTGVMHDRATRKDEKTTTPVKTSLEMRCARKKSWNSSIKPVMTHSRPPI